jgi:hypothetical protein
MHDDFSGSARRAAAAAACLLAVALTAPAAAGAVVVNLHVEAGGKALAPGYGQVTRTMPVTTTHRASCNGSGRDVALTGPTPLGALVAAQGWLKGLRPVEVSDEFSFGLFVCGVGGFNGSSDAYWLYKVNHVAPEVGADAYKARTGDDVLWYFQNTKTGENTGDELALDVPARARPGQAVDATVTAFDPTGKRKPAAGASLLAQGGATATTGADGHARITFSGEGYRWVRASRGTDIPSPLVKVCVQPLDRCAPARPKRIYGTGLADRVRGTRGRDLVRTGAGDDVINVRGGRVDRVFCGSGRDLVRASRGDHVARDCEEVRRK